MDCSPPKRWKASNDSHPKQDFFPLPLRQRHLDHEDVPSSLATPPRLTRTVKSAMEAAETEAASRKDSGFVSSRHGSSVNLSPSASMAALHLSGEVDPDGHQYICPATLHSVLSFNTEAVLLLDCRAALAFDRTRIAQAVSVQFSALMLRRLKKQANVRVRVDHLQISDKLAVARRKDAHVLVVVYDEESKAVEALSPAGVLLRLLADEGIRPVFLRGGMATYRAAYPQDLGAARPSAEASAARKPLHPVLKAVSKPKPSLALAATVVMEHLILGNRSQGCNVDFLRRHGISHVINVTETPFHQNVIDMVKCMQIPLLDSGCHDLLSVVPDAVKFIERSRQDGGRTLVYCSTGCSRAAALTLAYLMATERFSYVSAVAELQRLRPEAKPHASFMQQLLDFHQALSSDVRRRHKRRTDV